MTTRSDQACKACKKQKRRCDKALPECSLCKRTQRLCEYGVAADSQPSASDWSTMKARLSELENRLANSPRATEQHVLSPISGPSSGAVLEQGSTPGATLRNSIDTHSIESNGIFSSSQSIGFTPAYSTVDHPGSALETRFPTSMFLDVDCCVWSHAILPVPTGNIPAPVLALLSQGNVVLDVSQTYFATIHIWFPMISKKRMDMGLPVQNAGPDLAILFLGMKLVTTPAIDITGSALYDTAKSFVASLESNGVVSLLCLQAMILVALYEYSHAIYPAAWMTVGSCARYADILGIMPGEYSPLGQVTTWTEAEERRRVWWSIYILDKLVSLGSRKRCLLPEFHPQCKLPVDDDVWVKDRGQVNIAINHSTSISYHTQQEPYARLCQASMYLGRAISYAQDNSTMTSSRIEEIMSLAGELSDFATVVDNESAALSPEKSLALLAPRFIFRSALFVALERFTCPENISAEPGYIEIPGDKTLNEIELQRQSMCIIEQASEQIHTVGTELLRSFRTEGIFLMSEVSPFILDSIYASAATFHWLLGEGENEVYRTAAADFDFFLDTISSRWRLGSTYREMLTVHDVTARVEARTT
ncbi:fungal specific transcription factor factor [Fusarium subglutinans]|uniref:Fungal specific transcription factor factor n=1 Tax=Gibberella subglutinans TaxID=42677 RepID=A0A8H5KNK0_GIBSU|nr:fungal specific transcription factor factor [Fusarium subglutinans]KAF5575666.1 fungal specific transcription factor factor [Fusarium subglutinans]